MRARITPVILCGGSGTRLWPLSRASFPKQFLVLDGTSSLFQQAVKRVNDLAADDIHVGETLIVTNEEHRFLALAQLHELSSVQATLLLEPVGRNTAPALALAALQATASGDDPILVVTPADQTVSDNSAFTIALQNCIRIAQSGSIVMLGVTPILPETGFGYIKRQGEAGQHGEYDVKHFTEKPTLETAQAYLTSGDYLWNSGIFVLKASTWLKSLKYFRPDIAAPVEKSWVAATVDVPFVRPDIAAFSNVPSDSIDYAVMEHCPQSAFPIQVISLDAGWNDLGSWEAVWNLGDKDANGNVTQGDALTVDTSHTHIHANSRLVAAIGVKDLIIVETSDAVLVTDRKCSQQVKILVALLDQRKREEINAHRKVHRPWGWYDNIDEGDRFKVKRIHVNPNASLSLQKHFHRAEHWIVVRGVAEVTCGATVLRLTENQSTFISLGTTHRLANPGPEILELIEVQSGSYLGEDDIVRFDDSYGRKISTI